MKLEDKRHFEDAIIMVLKNIHDPEIPVNIFDLGLIYEITISDEFDVKVLMTLTAPNCPVAESMPQEVKDRVAAITGIRSAEVELTFEPPWSKDMISEEAMLDLGLL
ncbi:MAG: iron-sulfur cluster assembly protein [Hyphomicrobiales bacterium]